MAQSQSFVTKVPLVLAHKIDRLQYFLSNPLWLVMRQVCKFKLGRMLYRIGIPKTTDIPTSRNTSASVFEAVPTVTSVVEALKQDGMCGGFQLAPSVVEEIVQFAKSTPCYGDRRKQLGFYYDDREKAEQLANRAFAIGHFWNVPVMCSTVDRIRQDPALLAIAAHYLQGTPVHQGSQMWWTFAKPNTEAPLKSKGDAGQEFHYDLDDSYSVKFFFFLTDVDANSGAHVYVQGSHRWKQLRHQWKREGIPEAELMRTYGDDAVITVEGKAGLGFVEDTACFHRGIPSRSRDRLLLTVQYALRDYKMQSSIVQPASLSLVPGYRPEARLLSLQR
ncbi:MAG: phytanoyl-CoA dioxygenase family protein [Kaiparowitsia implicata GSE-PSE-MK54-09C]|jgi:ectoine hydroxylase-related dioxygenase (phytanoyl-CoA dioxygenase family)|nr:phytanoyl-CoA dioxygenase family protein [Kaiparowitsia implicata GSE-PSE-MK54-09C]